MRTLVLIISMCFALSLTSCATRVAVATPNVTVVRVAPKKHNVVVIKGQRYYYWNGRYHKKTRRGFVVVRV